MTTVKIDGGAVFDQETIALMRQCLDDAWDRLGAVEQGRTCKSALAQRILRAAAHGERDPVRLRTYALMYVAAPEIGP